MSQYVTLTSTTIRIKRADREALLHVLSTEIDGQINLDDSLELVGEADDVLEYDFCMTGDVVGDSFQDRIERVAVGIGPLLIEPCLLTVRTESMSDERDSHFYAGATQEAIDQLRVKTLSMEAIDSLSQLKGCQHPAAAALENVLAGVEAIRDGAMQKATLDPVVHHTHFGEIRLPAGKDFILKSSGHILVAASLREDGDADVVGSLDLDYLAFMDPDKASAARASFLQMHQDLGVFAIVETITDVLEIHKDDNHGDEDVAGAGQSPLSNP